MSEEWRDIKGFEGLYQVSNLGNVKRIKHGGCKFGYGYRTLPERMVKQHPDYHGYKRFIYGKTIRINHYSFIDLWQ